MDLGISQRKLAKLLGVDKKSVENWEKRQMVPARRVASRISEFLGLQHAHEKGSLGARLTAYRWSLGLSQAQLAKHLGVDRCTIVHWETATTKPAKLFRERIENLLRKVLSTSLAPD